MSTEAAQFQERTGVSRETLERLECYAVLLTKWNQRINLISAPTLADLWHRHFFDSAQILNAAPAHAASWADLGSGGGFPGLVVAVLAAEKSPLVKVTLIESDQRKAAFLRTVSRETGVDVVVLADRIEQVPPLNVDVVSARALAPLRTLLGYCQRHLAPGGTALLPKGAQFQEECTKALETWQFRCENLPSVTDDRAVILKITEIASG